MNSLLKDLPQTPISAEYEQALFLAGGTEKLILHTLVQAIKYIGNARRCNPVNISLAEKLSLCYAALSKSVRTFKPGMKSFLAYSKPFLRGEMCKHWRDKNVVRDSYRHEKPADENFPQPIIEAASSDPAWEEIHYKELWAQVEPVIRKTLKPIEIRVLEYRYKFSLTLEETGKQIKRTRARVKQIESEAMEKLRGALSIRLRL